LPADPFQEEVDGIVTLHRESPATALVGDFLGAGPQLELDDPGLRAWVAANSDGGGDDAERLRLAVRSHITTKDLSKGDGSALETFRSHTGDCTEHATLLCAALRIARIPARIVVGLVYVPEYGGWVGHAWNSAYVGGRWVHLDSAYPGIPRSCYLALGHGDNGATGAQLLVQLNRVLGQRIEVLP
jgi:transglutaminase-like putative cysteine protease